MRTLGIFRRPLLLAIFIIAAAGLSGCILMEDPAEIEGTTSVPTDTSDDAGDVGGDDVVDMTDGSTDLTCETEGPTACGPDCLDCTSLPGVEVASCAAGACVIDACVAGSLDCDGDPGNGCEATESASVCGASCIDCTGASNASEGACVAGVCQLTCEDGFLDCDANLANGCERSEGIEACGDACLDCSSLDHVAQSSCGEAGCLIEACEWGWQDCNGDPADGCEQAYSDTMCGAACGDDCTALPGVDGARCFGEYCGVISCELGYKDLNGDWADGCEAPCALGECWNQLPEPYSVSAFFDGTDYGVVGSVSGLVYVTDDGGLTWSPRQTPLTSDIRVVAVGGPNLVFVIGTDGKLARSLDQGVTWTQILLPISIENPLSVATDGQQVALVGSGLFAVSNDQGETWEDFSDDIVGQNLQAVYVGEQILMAGANGTVLRTNDGGLTIVPVNSPTSSNVRFLHEEGGTIYAGGNLFLSETTDWGLTWTEVAGLPSPQYSWENVSTHGEAILLTAGSRFALRRAATEPFEVVEIVDDQIGSGRVAEDGTALLFAYGGLHHGHVLASAVVVDEMGEELLSYERLNMTYPEHTFVWVEDYGQKVFFGGAMEMSLYVSDDDALNVAEVEWPEELVTSSVFNHAAFTDEQEGLLTTSDGRVFHTIDGGTTWDASFGLPEYQYSSARFENQATKLGVLTGSIFGVPATFIASGTVPLNWAPIACNGGICSLMNPNVQLVASAISDVSIIVGTSVGELLLSTNGGNSWSQIFAPFDESNWVGGIYYDGLNIAFFTTGAGVGSRIFYSGSNGNNWPDPNGGPTPVFDGTLATPQVYLRDWSWDDESVVAVGLGGVMLYSSTRGRQWDVIDLSGVTTKDLYRVFLEGDVIVAVSLDGSVIYSVDGGQSFETSLIPLKGGAVHDITFQDGRLMAVGLEGQIFFSTAGL